MVLSRPLPPYASLRVPANRHHFGLLCKSCTKPTNPLSLTLFLSSRYARNGPCRSHYAYLCCFHQVVVKKGPSFRKSEWFRFLSCTKPAGRRLRRSWRVSIPSAQARFRKKHAPKASWNVAWNQWVNCQLRSTDFADCPVPAGSTVIRRPARLTAPGPLSPRRYRPGLSTVDCERLTAILPS